MDQSAAPDFRPHRPLRAVAGRAGAKSDAIESEMIAMLAHELRNGLDAIGHAVETLKYAKVDDTLRERACAMTDRQLHNMSRMIDDLLAISPASTTKISLQVRPIDLAAVLTQVVETGRDDIEAHGLDVRLALPAEAMIVDGDHTRLEQIFDNLVINAVKFTPHGGHIRIAASLERGGNGGSRATTRAVIRVRDDGIGIAPEMLPRVFDLFAQAKPEQAQSPRGLGIGLALVKRLVELHGGSVESHSDGPGTGSEFVVRLPLSSGGLLDTPPTDEPLAASPRLAPRRILDSLRNLLAGAAVFER